MPEKTWSSSYSQQKTCVQSQKQQNDLCSFPGRSFSITVMQVYELTSNAKEHEVEWFYEDPKDLLEHPKKYVLSS